MPKANHIRSRGHEQSARLPKRQADGAQLEAQATASDPDMMQLMAESEQGELPLTLKKKQRQALKHELFLKRLEESRSPYSKSHERRMKRKAKEQVAGGLSDLQAVISAMDEKMSSDVVESIADGTSKIVLKPKKTRTTSSLIGESKCAPLSKEQRKRALQVERVRIPMILSNPDFASNPFQTIRTHAQNTLMKHDVPQKMAAAE